MKKSIRILSFFLGILALIVLIGTISWLVLNRTNGEIISGGEKRRYLLYVPESYDPAVLTPLVINIHGFAQWPANQMQVSQWNELADQYGFIVVYPSGTGFPLRWRVSEDPAEPESSTRTTAEAAGGPTFRRFEQRQHFFLWLLSDLLHMVISRRALVDKTLKSGGGGHRHRRGSFRSG